MSGTIYYPEQWRQFRDTEYWVSDEGRIKRKYKNGKEVIQQGVRVNNSIKVAVYKDKLYLSRVVWETWRGEIPQGYVVSHKNGCVTMNDIYNLELIPKSEQTKKGKDLNSYWVEDTLTGKRYSSLRKAEKDLHIGRNTISTDIKGEQKRFRLIKGRGKVKE